MTHRERFLCTLNYEPVDRRPLYLAEPWQETLARWRGEGLPADVENVHGYLGVTDYGYRMTNITPVAGPFPAFERRTVREEGDAIYYIDAYGRTVHDFKSKATIPEWVEFPVKEAADLRRYLDEHFDVANLDARFAPDWADKALAAQARGDVIMIDGGCYYWTLRSIAGVDGASYLLFDAPDLVDELCERYFTVVMEGLRRAVTLVTVDVIGFGEDFAFKTGPLLSPAMFRRFIKPRYAKTMAFAHEHDIRLTWHDSDGDCRLLLPDMLSVDVNSTVPCEVAAGMDPVALRAQFGRELRIGGGVDKRIVAAGPEAVMAELARLAPEIREGGFVPGIDHSVPADVSWDHYRAYLDLLLHTVEESA
jgi:uroporphyrinogen decarboxylase